MNTKQLLERKKSIGASEWGIIQGVNKYKTLKEYFDEKLDPLPPKQFSNIYTQRGIKAEPRILARYGYSQNVKVYRHPRYYYITATPDALAQDNSPIEVKTHDAHFAGERNIKLRKLINTNNPDVIGAGYYAQCQAQMFVMQADYGKWIADLYLERAPNSFSHKLISLDICRNEKFIRTILKRIEIFKDALEQNDFSIIQKSGEFFALQTIDFL